MPNTPINVRKAQSLCTAPEFALVRSAQPRALAALSEAQLKKKIDRARELRDKWKTQAATGRRRAQQTRGRRDVESASRSREKAALFDNVLKRLRSRSAELRASERSAATAERTVAGKKANKKKAAKKKTAKKKAAPKSGAKSGVGSGERSSKKSSTAAAKRKGRARASASTESAETPHLLLHPGMPHRGGDLRPGGGADAAPFANGDIGGAQLTIHDHGGVEPSTLGQVRSQAAAKQRRIEASGLRSRVRGHVSARGRRAQARRDG